ncbi:MAG: LuxR C-terminal-related transcriptional regulator [Saprospiraceae bacterium]
MAKGFSNREIADQLFLSLNTIKSHSSNIFSKMDVKRRTQAIDKAKSLGILG